MVVASDVLLKNFLISELRVTIIHSLIEELVDDNKVVSNTLFVDLFEVAT